ncbi:hypothetical protein SAMN05216215_103351 [Saccharopolyspora shandongensis]|uniref:Uncharacterized protein n=1 Tax=Saccharopolyspora shandongensis TaxID=418495 RepID=A0A1H3M6B3_9PSEU|nr:hypothetical protein [Saccharopolyspora shandongensis]SDY71545.1 hypothetical protein SAMN05216215_103351 [Saccharopolyspora shandongensis]
MPANPKSAESAWVQHEVQFWKEQGRAKSLLIVLTDGEIRLTASSETTITTAMLWNVGDLPDVVARATELACAAAGPGFTEQEWNVRAPGLPYRRLCP